MNIYKFNTIRYKKNNFVKEIYRFVLFFVFLFTTGFVNAISISDANIIFNTAEQQYPQFFIPKNTNTLQYEQWIYRYYNYYDIYLGINTYDQVYLVINGEFNYVSTVPEIKQLLGINDVSGNDNVVNFVGTWLAPSPPSYNTGWRYIFNSDGMGYAQLYQYQNQFRQWTPFGLDQTVIRWSFLNGTINVSGLSFNTRTYKVQEARNVNNTTFVYVFDEVYRQNTAFVKCISLSCSDAPAP
jgi:hypothetical protein